MPTSGPEWNLSKTPLDVQLAVGESVLSDTVCISPEGKLFSQPGMLKMPFNIYEVPELTEIVFEFLDLNTHQWRRMVAVFTVDGKLTLRRSLFVFHFLVRTRLTTRVSGFSH